MFRSSHVVVMMLLLLLLLLLLLVVMMTTMMMMMMMMMMVVMAPSSYARPLQQPQVTYNILINACVGKAPGKGRVEAALALAEEMKAKGIRYDRCVGAGA